jgi:hypothetical protein
MTAYGTSRTCQALPAYVGYWGKTGQHMLNASFSLTHCGPRV